jgi:hypothetical protein
LYWSVAICVVLLTAWEPHRFEVRDSSLIIHWTFRRITVPIASLRFQRHWADRLERMTAFRLVFPGGSVRVFRDLPRLAEFKNSLVTLGATSSLDPRTTYDGG